MVERLAHVCTPWAWRDRRTVVALAVLGVVLCVASIAAGLANTGASVSTRLVGAGFWGIVSYLVFAYPAVRSRRRWDEAHPPT